MSSTPARLPLLPENLLRKRKKSSQNEANSLRAAIRHRKSKSVKRRVIFKRAEQFIREYRAKDRDETRLKRQAKLHKNFYVPDEPKLAFVVRIKGITGVSPKCKKVMQLLRLKQINNGTFLQLNKATTTLLRLIEPYVTWGYPNLKTVRDLVYKRGCGKVQGRRIPLTDNAQIEKALGKFNLICTEDLVHEMFTVGPNFKYATNFLWPFKLNNPTGGWRKKNIHFTNGGDYGNREEKINILLRKMI